MLKPLSTCCALSSHLDYDQTTTRRGATAAAADPVVVISGRGLIISFAMPLVARSRRRQKNKLCHHMVISIVRSNCAAASGILVSQTSGAKAWCTCSRGVKLSSYCTVLYYQNHALHVGPWKRWRMLKRGGYIMMLCVCHRT